MIAGRPLRLTEGTQRRDIIHVEDIIRIIHLIINKGFRGFRSLPAGTGESHSVKEIIQFLHKEINSSSRLEFGAIPMRKNEPDTLADISWYKEAGYELRYTFFEGLRQYCRELMMTDTREVLS